MFNNKKDKPTRTYIGGVFNTSTCTGWYIFLGAENIGESKWRITFGQSKYSGTFSLSIEKGEILRFNETENKVNKIRFLNIETDLIEYEMLK